MAEPRISQNIQALGQVIKLIRPGFPHNEPTPSTSGIPPEILKQEVDTPNPTQSTTKYNTENCQSDKETVTPLCSACKEVPRIALKDFTVLQCQNGHIICTDCRPKIATCPLCRSTTIDNRNLFVEHYIETKMQHRPYKCRHDPCEVNIRMLAGDLAEHETFCIHRESRCINKQCGWYGNLSKLIPHIQDKKCAHINLDDDHQKRAKQPIGVQGSYTYKFQNRLMFPNHDKEIFQKINVDTMFKPILLVANGITNLYCYLLIDRSNTGIWTFTVYSKLKPEDAKNVKATLLIGDKDTNYSHTTKLVSHQHDKYHVKEQGNFMQLDDTQVKRLNNGLQLFEFEVSIQPDPTFIREANTKANMGRQNFA